MLVIQLLTQILSLLAALFGGGAVATEGGVDSTQFLMLLLQLFGSGGGCSSCG